jgi:puromycin-sensitive aminopeptidase
MTSPKPVPDRVLLPTNLKPIKYNITLEPDLEQFTFEGEEMIEFQVNEPTEKVVLNAKELTVTGASVDGKKAVSIDYDHENEYVIFHFEEQIRSNGNLYISFNGILNDKMVGFYRAKYEKDGETRYMAATQFEAADCRRCIPCFDEPAVKAVFEVTLIVPKNRVALSNMNIVQEIDHREKQDKKIVKFAPSPIMSTYLLAFVVGEYEYIEQYASNNVRIRVYTQVGKTEQGKFALDIAVKVLPWLEEYFNQKYPLPKCDLIAIPDMSAGAMENWGLITYREAALLVDPESSSAQTKQWVALVVSHELSHQWFGNLSTMAWWQDLWLNEGFATYLEYLCVDKLYPEWNVFEQFVYDDFGQAQKLDGLESSHPVEVDVRVAREIDEVFDAISYSKGCAIIRMLVNYMGLDTFNKGLKNYLEKFKYKNATTNDLWDALSDASGQPIGKMMTSWTRQTGYPLVSITEGKEKNTFTLTQCRYLDKGLSKSAELWYIPFGYVTSENTKKPIFKLLTEKTSTITIEGNFDWVKFNYSQTGFFRVHYPLHYYKLLIPVVRSKQLDAIDRLGIQEDAVSLARAGIIPSNVALEVLSAYDNEDNFTVLNSLTSNLDMIYNIIKYETYADKFKQFACNLVKKQYKKLGWTPKSNESHLDSMMRALILNHLAKYEDPDIIEIGKLKYIEFLKDHNSVAPDLRTALLSIALATGGKKEYDQVIKYYKSSSLQEEQVRCLRAIGATKDTNLIKQALDFSLSDDVRAQNAFYVVYSVADNPLATDILWLWFTANIEKLKERYDGGYLYGRFIKSATKGFVKKDELDKVKMFFSDEKNKTVGSLRSIEQAVEVVELNCNWLERASNDIAKFFAEQ